MTKDKITVDVTINTDDIKKELNGMRLQLVSTYEYTVDIEHPDQLDYAVFYKGKKVLNCSIITFDTRMPAFEKDETKVASWKMEMNE